MPCILPSELNVCSLQPCRANNRKYCHKKCDLWPYKIKDMSSMWLLQTLPRVSISVTASSSVCLILCTRMSMSPFVFYLYVWLLYKLYSFCLPHGLAYISSLSPISVLTASRDVFREASGADWRQETGARKEERADWRGDSSEQPSWNHCYPSEGDVCLWCSQLYCLEH